MERSKCNWLLGRQGKSPKEGKNLEQRNFNQLWSPNWKTNNQQKSKTKNLL